MRSGAGRERTRRIGGIDSMEGADSKFDSWWFGGLRTRSYDGVGGVGGHDELGIDGMSDGMGRAVMAFPSFSIDVMIPTECICMGDAWR